MRSASTRHLPDLAERAGRSKNVLQRTEAELRGAREARGIEERQPPPHVLRQNGDVTQDQVALIATDPAVCHGQPTLAGTRVLVSVVLDCLAAGMTTDEIRAEYPSLTEEGIRAAAAYGAALAREELVPLPPSA